MQLNGAEILIEVLIKNKVDTIFGYPGGSVLFIYDALYKKRDYIKHVLTAHEQGAAHAADGYARVTGKTAVVFATSGPGATNLVTGIANAFLDSTPMVVITGNVATTLLGKDTFQEVDIVGVTMPIVKHSFMIKDIEELADTVNTAFAIASSGRPGPVLIDIPKDVQSGMCEYDGNLKKPVIDDKRTVDFSDAKIDKAVELIKKAKKPYIYCGGGAVLSNSGQLLIEFADKIDAVIGTSMMGLSAIPNSYKNNLGMTGMHGKYVSSMAHAKSDLIIAVGVRFSDRATGDKDAYTKNTSIIHIDIDPAEIGKNIKPDVGMSGDVFEILKKLISKTPKIENKAWLEEVDGYKKEQEKNDPQNDLMVAKNIIQTINKYTDDETNIVTDVGQHQMWAVQYYKFQKPRTLITSGGLGTMGFGMGAAIGSCIGKNYKRTILFTGDGSFGMNLNELATAVSQKLPLIVVIINNNVLGMVRQWQTSFYEKRYSSTILDRKTDFVKLAEAFGARGYRATTLNELNYIVKECINTESPVVIDCVVDKDDRVLPMIPPGGSINDMIVK
ncbi:MAG: biosynthetic-type acetolactate synthase large subunit [Bacilli bacterium]